MNKIVLEQKDDTLQVTVPTDTARRLGWEAGQELTLVDLPDGLQLLRGASERDRQIALAQRVLTEQAEALQLLSQR